MKRWLKITLGGAAVLAITGIAAKDYVLLHLPGWLAPRVHPFREIAWQPGPARAPQPADWGPPNIVLIVADDLGFNDISFNGGGVANGLLKTPNIDALGAEGATFANGYAGNATCAPSRAALMTGRYPTRFGFEFTPTDTRFAQTVSGFSTDWQYKTILDQHAVDADPPSDSKGVPASERTIAELLRTGGYHTMHLGKWHLGGSPGMRPEDQGFDESLGFIIGGQMFLPENDANVVNAKQDFDPIDKYIWANLPFSVQYNGGERFHPDRYMTDYLTHQAVRAIDANRNRPFFLYLAYNAPHTPLQALKSDYDALAAITDHRTRTYAAMIRALDRGVGQVMAALKARGLDENTLVIFTSDNGGAHYIGLPDINQPYRGWKASFFEGGIKVPFFLRWPAKIAPATRVAGTVSHFDIFATAAGAAGIAVPGDRPIDGIDLSPIVVAQGASVPQRPLFWRSGAYRVVRDGDAKLQMLDIPRQSLLYDMNEDPTEQRDLSAVRPDEVRRLAALIAQHDAAQAKPAWPSLIRSPIAIDRPLGTKPRAGETYAYWSN
ncbi:sulfatase-like hydrolase/transferase [Sphingomonas radiodurans]|uniref:sulfatase-like hydrolase/transferase n=1 Tax=Sphingomonas radiodurans TaxID=2890321 RepID=UPI001E43DD85|nr:sulfatase-like hydrolase/transferase [Sphingomonas radiodurans]WBH17602.1 sulfatase-like hydrolase/transferase [Sphingomonas radiodurans]